MGLALCLVAGLGLASGWLGAWGSLLWVPMLIYGLVHACLLGHFIILWPVWLLATVFGRLRGHRNDA